MENKPFTIQSPEEIAKDYGGNKQKIAEAMQMGILDPTAGTLAGMFIDRMRSAAQMEGAPQQTVAEQVFAPPAPPMGAPMGAPAGLGATPEAAAMPPQEMGPPPQEMAPPPQEMAPPPQEMAMPQEMPSMAEGGMVPPYMSGGGLSEVPIPDGMFDEPSNGGYAGGGMVAFGRGGGIDFERFRKAIIAQESGGDYGVANAEGSGALGAYQFMPPTARALAERLGLPYRPDLLQGNKGRSKEGRAYQDALGTAQLQDAIEFGGGDIGKAGAFHFAGPNTKGHGAKTRQYEKDILRRYSGSKDAGGEELVDAAQGDDTVYGLPTNLRGNIDLIKSLMPAEAAEDIEYRKELTEKLSPENRARGKKDAFFQGLGDLSERIANAKDKSTFGSIFGSLGGGAGDISKRLDAEEKDIREMQRERSALANLSRKEEIEAMKMGVDVNKSAAVLNEGIEARKEDVAYKRAMLDIERAKIGADLAKIAADSEGKENTKERFVETFYNVLIRKGYSENQARQFAYLAAEKQLAKLKAEYPSGGDMGTLFPQGATGATGGTADTLDYGSLK
jgi:hypothetical protein